MIRMAGFCAQGKEKKALAQGKWSLAEDTEKLAAGDSGVLAEVNPLDRWAQAYPAPMSFATVRMGTAAAAASA